MWVFFGAFAKSWSRPSGLPNRHWGPSRGAFPTVRPRSLGIGGEALSPKGGHLASRTLGGAAGQAARRRSAPEDRAFAEGSTQASHQALSPSATHRLGLAHTASPARRGRPLLASPAQLASPSAKPSFWWCPVLDRLGHAQFEVPPLSKAGSNQLASKHDESTFVLVLFLCRYISKKSTSSDAKHPVALKYTN